MLFWSVVLCVGIALTLMGVWPGKITGEQDVQPETHKRGVRREVAWITGVIMAVVAVLGLIQEITAR